MKTETELFENALDTTSVNGKKLREYINENYILKSVIDKIRAEIEQIIREEIAVDCVGGEYERIISTIDPDDVLEIIDKYRAESEEKTNG